MKKIKENMILLPILLLILGSCSSAPDQIDSDLPEEVFFKTAQDAMDEDKYNVALYYYEVYLVRYPELHDRTIAAEYERAFIYYKMKDLSYSKNLFLQILDKYESSPFSAQYPERYRILSEKVLEKIDILLTNDKEKESENTEI